LRGNGRVQNGSLAGPGGILVRSPLCTIAQGDLAWQVDRLFFLPSRLRQFLMRQQIGFLLQFVVLVFLPMLILWQLEFGFRLILMPALTLVGIIVFWIGYKLREG
jgi:hypothetical protein